LIASPWQSQQTTLLQMISFNSEEANKIGKEVVESILQNRVYNATQAHEWITTITSECLKRLTTLNKPFKYIG
jgi:dynein light chain Tctex-type 1